MKTAPVTDEQIQALRDEAAAVGDWKTAELCDIALDKAFKFVGGRTGHYSRRTIKLNGNRLRKGGARQECARTIKEAKQA